jgi:flagellar protein FliL
VAKEEIIEEAVEEKPKKKRGLIVILAVVVLALAGAGGGAWWYFSGSVDDKQVGADEKEVSADDKSRPPVYEKLDQFTVNLSGGEDRYLQVDISLKLVTPALAEKIKQRSPELRDSLLRLLSSKTAEELSSVEGKNKLGDEIQDQVNRVLHEKRRTGVQAVLFTSFIIQ